MRLTRRRIGFAVVLVGLLILSLFIVTTNNLFYNKKSSLWAYNSRGTINSISISQQGSLVAIGVGFTGTKGAVILLDGSGNVIWEHQTDRIIAHVSMSSNGSHIEADGYQLLGGGGGVHGGGPAEYYANSKVYAFDFKGDLLWSRDFSDSPLYAVMSRDGSRIAVSMSSSVSYLAWDGKILWNYTAPSSYPYAILSQNGSRVAISVSNPSNVTMLNADGKALWTFRDTALAATYSDGVFTTRGDLIAAGNSGSVYLLTERGTLLWRQYVDSLILSAAVLPNGSSVGYVTNNNVLFFDRSGELIATHATEGKSTLLPTPYGFLLGGYGGNVVLFDARGKSLWNFSLGVGGLAGGGLAEAVSGNGAFAAASSGVAGQGGQGFPSTLYFFAIGNKGT